MSPRLRPSVLTAGFAVLFAVIANLAWATAIATTGPWFDAGTGLAVYSVALVLATVLVVFLVQQATARISRLDASLVRLDRRIALLRAAPRGRPSRDHGELRIEVGERADGGARAVLRGDKEGHDSLVRLPAESRPAAGSARTELLRQMSRERVAIRAARGQVWSAVAGPALTSILFLVIAGPMLPGSGGFAAAHYALNTTLILFLSYGIAPLVAWSALALILIGSPAGTTSTEA